MSRTRRDFNAERQAEIVQTANNVSHRNRSGTGVKRSRMSGRNMAGWFYSTNDQQHGPVSAKELKRLASSGQITPEVLVRKEDSDRWKKASSVRSLFPSGTPSDFTEKVASFDPYHKWLAIAKKDQPPTHYRLLGVDLYESDPDVIDTAANKQMTYLHGCATGQHADFAEQLLNEMSAARLCLLDRDKKAAYDEQLRAAKRTELILAHPPNPIVVEPAAPTTLIVQATKRRRIRTLKSGIMAVAFTVGIVGLIWWANNQDSVGSSEQNREDEQVIATTADGDANPNSNVNDSVKSPNASPMVAPFVGLWDIKYDNQVTRRYWIRDDGSVHFDGQLYRLQQTTHGVTIKFPNVKQRELLSLSGGELKVRHFNFARKFTNITEFPTNATVVGVGAQIASLSIPSSRFKGIPEVVRIDDHFYKVFWHDVPWPQAKALCEAVGGQLACLETRDEQEKVAALKGEGKVVWVGAVVGNQGRLSWVNGKPVEDGRIGTFAAGSPEARIYRFAAYAITSELNLRPIDGRVKWAVDHIQGFICEWDE